MYLFIYFQFRSSHLADRETCDRVVVPLLPHRAADGDKRSVRSTIFVLYSILTRSVPEAGVGDVTDEARLGAAPHES